MGGKRTDILSLQETLKKIYYGLNTTNAGSKMDYISDILKYLWLFLLLMNKWSRELNSNRNNIWQM